MQGYTISTSNLQNWFDQLMKQEVQQFLGTFSRSGEGEGGPAPKQSALLEELFVDLSGLGFGFRVYPKHGRDWHVYGDSAFTLTRHIQTGFRPSSNPSESNALYTYLMNSGRIAVEWGYGKVTSTWKYLDYKPQLKLHSSPLGSLYRVATCLTNMKICLEGCLTTEYFNCEPPSLEEYISWRL